LIAVDTNLLVYAHRSDSPWHDRAAVRLRELAEGPSAWAIPWPCLHEFLAIATHPQIYQPPSTISEAVGQMKAWLASPSVVLLSELGSHAAVLAQTLTDSRVVGPNVHDARIAALCLSHGVRELWSADRDFSRFANLVTRNPLVT
jgi:toxin-antitoxin system PIN domain toxin